MGKLGYNAVMLYTEDTYKLEGVPKWGYMRGDYYDVHATPSPELSAKIPEGARLRV